MGLVEDIQSQLDTANTKLDGIQGDVASLKQQIADLIAAGSGATQTELQVLLDSATALAAKAGGIDDQTP